MKNSKIIKIVLIIVIIVLTIGLITFAGSLFRKHLIISKIDKNLQGYCSKDNYSIKVKYYNERTEEYYQKGDKHALFIDTLQGNSAKYYFENKDGNGHQYIMSPNENIANLNLDYDMTNSYSTEFLYIYYDIEKDNFLDYVKSLNKLKITLDEFDGKECYKISNFDESEGILLSVWQSDYNDNQSELEYEHIIYIEKDTGLKLKDEVISRIGDETQTLEKIYSYEFDKVTDEIFNEPDIENFTKIE